MTCGGRRHGPVEVNTRHVFRRGEVASGQRPAASLLAKAPRRAYAPSVSSPHASAQTLRQLNAPTRVSRPRPSQCLLQPAGIGQAQAVLSAEARLIRYVHYNC